MAIVVSSKEGSASDGSNSNHSSETESSAEMQLESKAMSFCRLVNKMLRNQNSSCFVGYEVIYEMVASGLAKDRAEALSLGKDLSKKMRLFYRVEFKRNTFSDDGKLYKFRPEKLLSVIMKCPMNIQKLTSSDYDRDTETVESSTPIKFRRFCRKSDASESNSQEITTLRTKCIGKINKKGKRMKGHESVKTTDQMHMIPQQNMASIREWGDSSDDDDQSVYTEITVSERNIATSFPPVPSKPQHEEDEDSYMEVTVSNSNRDAYSYIDEYTLHDEDEYDIMSVPTTPVVRQKLKVRPKVNIPVNDMFSPNEVMGFDNCVAEGSPRRTSKGNRDNSLSSRMRRGELDIEIPNLDAIDEDICLEDI
jgi:hypothetical protein